MSDRMREYVERALETVLPECRDSYRGFVVSAWKAGYSARGRDDSERMQAAFVRAWVEIGPGSGDPKFAALIARRAIQLAKEDL